MTLAGKTALVTGGGRGIGRAICERLAGDGARVAVHYGRNEAAAHETVEAIERAGGSAFTVAAELGVPDDAEVLWAAFDHMVDQAQPAGRPRQSRVDILVNNAGINGPRAGFSALKPDEFDELVAVNTKAPFFVTQHALPRMRDGGRIINISTGLTAAAAKMPAIVAYTMSKAALNPLMTILAKELGARGITVNSVAPGVVDTDMNADWLRTGDEARQSVARLAALGRVGEPADIAEVVAFLASDHGGWITGQWIDATGGSLF